MATAVGIDLGTTNSVIAAWQGGAPSVTSGCRGSRSWATKTSEVVECSSVPVLVDLCATWCGPRRMVSPALEQLATERAGQLKLVKVDVDKAPAVAQQLAIQAVPTLGPQRP